MPNFNVTCTKCERPSKNGAKCSKCSKFVPKPSQAVKGANYFEEQPAPTKGPKPTQGGDTKQEGKENKKK